MENTERRKYFLRKPVEYQLRCLQNSFEEMSKIKTYPESVRVAYKVCSSKLRELITEIVRDDNQHIRKLNHLDSLIDTWKDINEQLNNSTKNK